MNDRPLIYGPLLHFRSLAPFDGLGSRHLAAIAYESDELIYPGGATLVESGQPADAFLIVIDGTVELTDPAGWTRVSGPGTDVGLMAALAQGHHQVTARAVTSVTALSVTWDSLREVCEQHFPILAHLVAFVAGSSVQVPRRDTATRTAPPSFPPHPASLDLVDRISALHRSHTFPSGSMDALAELARHLVEVRLDAEQHLWRAGDPSDDFVLVCSGSIDCSAPGGSEAWSEGPYATVGIHEALAGLPRRYEARTGEAFVGLSIDVEPLLDILEDHFEMAVELLSQLAGDLLVQPGEEPAE